MKKLLFFGVTILLSLGYFTLAAQDDQAVQEQNEASSDTTTAESDSSDTTETKPTVHFVKLQGNLFRPSRQYGKALMGLANAMKKYTHYDAVIDRDIYLSSDDIHDYPFLYILTDERFELSGNEVDNVGKFIENGGVFVLESAVPHIPGNQAEVSMKQSILKAIDNKRGFVNINNNHELFSSFFDFDGPPLGIEHQTSTPNISASQSMVARDSDISSSRQQRSIYFLEGIMLRGKLCAIYSGKGYGVKWFQVESQDSSGGGEPHMKFGVNMVVFALKQHGLYEEPEQNE